MLGFLKNRRRRRVMAQLFPPAWEEILEQNVAIYQRLPEEDRKELQRRIQVFLAEKRFEGCGGLVITDEMRLIIAAQACLLLLHRKTDFYPGLDSIVVYPSAYLAPTVKPAGPGLVTEGEENRLGEAWRKGPLVLSWEDVLADAAGSADGTNVVLHEFAHELDNEDGAANGAPLLERGDLYAEWSRVLGAAYEQLKRDVESGREGILDEYGATDPAEFFAVATECFFERPIDLRQEQPELYDKLKEFFRQDPVQYAGTGG